MAIKALGVLIYKVREVSIALGNNSEDLISYPLLKPNVLETGVKWSLFCLFYCRITGLLTLYLK